MPEPDDEVERLERLDSCVVSDALDTVFGMSSQGVVTGITPLWPCGRVAGRVVTVALGPVERDEPRPKTHLGTAAIERAGNTDVIVVDNGGRIDSAGWGGLLTLAATTRGVRGALIHGACRDVDEAAGIGFPVFAAAPTPRTARSRSVERSNGQPIEVQSTRVHEGDLVIADMSGVVFVERSAAAAVLEVAERLSRREAALADAIGRGQSAAAVLGSSYESMTSNEGAE